MAVSYLGEEPTARTGTTNGFVRTYARQFKLETSLQSEGPVAVGSHASLPRIGSAHPEDPGAWCNSLTPKCVAGWKAWVVDASYSSEREMNEDPTAEPAIITWNSEQFQAPAVKDRNGDSICNSAGDPFDPPLQGDDSRRVVTVTKNVPNVPPWILAYQDAVNSDAFSLEGVTIAVGKAKMQAVAVGERQFRNDVSFRVVSFTLHLQKNGWNLKPLDAGFRKLVGAVREVIIGDDDEPVPAPVPLDGSGDVLTDPSTTNNVFLDFEYYAELPFSVLPLS